MMRAYGKGVGLTFSESDEALTTWIENAYDHIDECAQEKRRGR